MWTRLSTGFGKGIRPVYLFVDATEYRQFLDLDTTVKKVVDRDFTFEFNKSLCSCIGYCEMIDIDKEIKEAKRNIDQCINSYSSEGLKDNEGPDIVLSAWRIRKAICRK